MTNARNHQRRAAGASGCASSTMTTGRYTVWPSDAMGVAVVVAVPTGVAVSVTVIVPVGVGVGVEVEIGVEVMVAVTVAVLLGVAVGVGESVGVTVGPIDSWGSFSAKYSWLSALPTAWAGLVCARL